MTLCCWLGPWNVTLLLASSHLECDPVLLASSHMECDLVLLAGALECDTYWLEVTWNVTLCCWLEPWNVTLLLVVSASISKALQSVKHEELHTQ